MTDNAGPTADLASTRGCLAELAGALGPSRGLEESQEMTWTGNRDRLWWGLLKLHRGGGNDVELACLSILNELSAGGREDLKPSARWG